MDSFRPDGAAPSAAHVPKAELKRGITVAEFMTEASLSRDGDGENLSQFYKDFFDFNDKQAAQFSSHLLIPEVRDLLHTTHSPVEFVAMFNHHMKTERRFGGHKEDFSKNCWSATEFRYLKKKKRKAQTPPQLPQEQQEPTKKCPRIVFISTGDSDGE